MDLWLTLSALFLSAAATSFTGWELRQNVRDRQETRRVETEGVAVTWQPKVRPSHAGASGRATWTYVVEAQNPGRLPIRNVTVVLKFPIEVQRVHYNDEVGASVRELELGAPALLGGGSRTWRRKVRVPFEARGRLKEIQGYITFTDADGKTHTNHMNNR